MGIRNSIFALLAVALASAALGGMIYTDAYSHAVRTEAIGYDALAREMLGASASTPDMALTASASADAGAVQQ